MAKFYKTGKRQKGQIKISVFRVTGQKMLGRVGTHILKTKSNLTLLLYLHFLGIGEWYFKCVKFILTFNQLFIRQLNFMFLLS